MKKENKVQLTFVYKKPEKSQKSETELINELVEETIKKALTKHQTKFYN